MPDIQSPFWPLILAPCAAAALFCLRCSVPLVLGDDEYQPFARLSRYLPLQGRWFRGLVGGLVLCVGMTLARFCGYSGLVWAVFMGMRAFGHGGP